MDTQDKEKYFNLCDPYEPLEPDDERNLNIDTFGEHPVRGINWVENLVQEIAPAKKPIFRLFTGHPGSGKTTELKRLAKQLSTPNSGNFFPVYIDALNIIDVANPVDVIDIMLAVLYSAIKTIAEKEEENLEIALNGGYFERLWNWLKNTDVQIGQGQFNLPVIGDLPFEMKTRPTLRHRIQNTIASYFQTFIKEVRDELEMLNNRVRSKFDKKGIIIIFDSIEKLEGITSNWRAVLESAEQIFGSGAPYMKLPVHVIYTVPAALATRVREIEFFPMIKVYEKDNENLYEPGIKAAHELIRKRLPDHILKEIFGSAVNEQLRHLILCSGGYPREIVRMIQMAISQKNHPISDSIIDQIIMRIFNQYRMVVPGEAFEWLAKVAKSKFLTIEDDDQRRIAAFMLKNNAVLCYLNRDLWFELHPALYQIPGVQEAIHELEKE